LYQLAVLRGKRRRKKKGRLHESKFAKFTDPSTLISTNGNADPGTAEQPNSHERAKNQPTSTDPTPTCALPALIDTKSA
jgi:hypothetical protein